MASDAAGSLAASNPWSAGFMAAGSVASAALSKPQSMNAQQSTGAVAFDNSGWAVNVGPGASQTASSSPSTGSAANLASLLQNPMVLLAIVAGLYFLGKRK